MTGDTIRRVVLNEFSTPLEFAGCSDLLEAFVAVLHGWSLRELTGETTDSEKTIRFWKADDVYQWSTPWGSHSLHRRRDYPPRTTVEALCDFHYDFVGWYLYEQPDILCLHCAAVEFGDGLVVFPCVAKAGKSTLTAQMVSRGHRVFSDDIMPIEPGVNNGVATGLQPRLRRPLPENFPDESRAFVEARSGPTNKRYVYLNLSGDEIAPYGETAPVKGFVLLERETDVAAEIVAESASNMLAEVIMQNSRRKDFPMEVFDRTHQLVSQADCVRLRYSNGLEAINLLEERFDR